MIDRRAWLRAVDSAPTLTSSAKRYAGWLIRRPVKGSSDEYKGGQDVAADALALSPRTIRNAEATLVDTGWLERCTRGTKHSAYSTFRLIDATVNRQLLPVENESQPELGGRLKLVGQPASFAPSMTRPPIRHTGTTAHTRRDRDAKAEQQRRRSFVARDRSTAPGSAGRSAARSSSMRLCFGTERTASFRRHNPTAGRSTPSHLLGAGAIA